MLLRKPCTRFFSAKKKKLNVILKTYILYDQKHWFLKNYTHNCFSKKKNILEVEFFLPMLIDVLIMPPFRNVQVK